MQPTPAAFDDALEHVFNQVTTRRAIVNVREYKYISSAAVSTLVKFFHASTDKGGQLLLL